MTTTARRYTHLNLKRKPGQALVFRVGEQVFTVRVGRVTLSTVTLEVDAPREVDIAREELLR